MKDEGLAGGVGCGLRGGLPSSVSLSGCEYICVQSMDGQLHFLHGDRPAFSCFLPDFLVPGPLGYLPRSDSLLTVNSAGSLQAFR